jgi:hypothetical protein
MNPHVEINDNRLHLYLPRSILEKDEVQRLKNYKCIFEDSGILMHVYGRGKEDIYQVDELEEISNKRYACTQKIWKYGKHKISPYGVAKTCEYMYDTGIEELLLRATNAPFEHKNLQEEALLIHELDPQTLRFENLEHFGMSTYGVFKYNNISFNTKYYSEFLANKTFEHHIIRTLLHELNHGVEAKLGINEPRPAEFEEHLAQYFALRVPYEAPYIIREYAPAIAFLKKNYEEGEAFTFYPATGKIETLDNAPPSPFRKVERPVPSIDVWNDESSVIEIEV